MVAVSTDAGAAEESMEELDDEVCVAVMKAVLTTVEMTPSEFEVMVVKVEVASIEVRCQRLIKLVMSKMVAPYALVEA